MRLQEQILIFFCALAMSASGTSPATAGGTGRGFVLADFESGQTVLGSYDGQDHDPDAWELTGDNTHDQSLWSLRLFGNTWKTQAIAPYAIGPETVFSVAACVERIGEMQGFGVTDGTNVLFYTFAGSELPTTLEWETTYQGAFPDSAWNTYLLPVGRDWRNRYGYPPTITQLIYLNDKDSLIGGAILFDDVSDVTSDLPVPPQVEILRGRERIDRIGSHLWRVGIQFASRIEDPDSEAFTYRWDFGDSAFSDVASPFHEFLVQSEHTYTVTLAVRDDAGMWGRDSAQVSVDPAQGEEPATIDFVGDVMLARGYDTPGGLIDQHGPEYIFIPTRPMFGDAADVNVCNLECPLTDEGTPHPTKSYVFRGRPTNVRGLSYAGCDLVSLGNNHIVDYGGRGCEETQEVLDAAQIRWSGAGLDEYVAFQPALWTERGIAVGMIGMCNRTGREYNYQPFLDAAYNKPGFAWMTTPNVDRAIDALRPLVDLVVVQAHVGIEYATDPWYPLGNVDPEIADAVGDEPGIDTRFRFPTRPTEADRLLKQHAIDRGADLVIAHHPHVLQGFEVYRNDLIAHSLGNFVFDQSFVETMPTVVLYSEFDKTGFLSFTFRPAFIDDMIPRPASGRLAREILDRQADYSRELNTVVTVDPATGTGTIHLEPAEVRWTVEAQEGTSPMSAGDPYWVSGPIERLGGGTLSRIVGIDGAAGDVEVRVGREILWHGGMEDEGATLWDLNSSDEVYDETISHSGRRSLRQHRTAQNSGAVTTDLAGYPPTLGGTEFSICGWLRTEDAREATLTARFFSGRGGTPVASGDAGPALNGTQDWTYQTADITVPEDVSFFNVRLRMDKPSSGESRGWYDDLRLVEWEAWQPATLPLSYAYPSNIRFVQVRCSGASDAVVVRWEDLTGTETPSHVAQDGSGEGSPIRLRLAPVRPNPVGGEGTFDYLLPRAGRAKLEIIDVSGRRVASLVDGPCSAGWHRAVWQSGAVPSGLYFCRLRFESEVRTAKLVVLRP